VIPCTVGRRSRPGRRRPARRPHSPSHASAAGPSGQWAPVDHSTGKSATSESESLPGTRGNPAATDLKYDDESTARPGRQQVTVADIRWHAMVRRRARRPRPSLSQVVIRVRWHSGWHQVAGPLGHPGRRRRRRRARRPYARSGRARRASRNDGTTLVLVTEYLCRTRTLEGLGPPR
jgi:hypothetical protein